MSFTARFRGECAQCDDPIIPGQEAEHDWGHNLQHVICPESLSQDGKPLEVCERCWTIIPVCGVCGVCE